MRHVVGLDIGNRRTGIAIASEPLFIARPKETVAMDTLIEKLQLLFREYPVDVIVVGLPRDMNGNETDQTRFVRQQGLVIQQTFPEKIVVFQDEALSSVLAKERLELLGRPYRREDIDSAAASILLEDWITHNKKERMC